MHQSSVFGVHLVRGLSSVESVVFANFSFFYVSDERGWRKLSSVGRLSNATSLFVAAAPPPLMRVRLVRGIGKAQNGGVCSSCPFSKETIVFNLDRWMICHGRVSVVGMIREFIEVEV